jgi:hypothetical protein
MKPSILGRALERSRPMKTQTVLTLIAAVLTAGFLVSGCDRDALVNLGASDPAGTGGPDATETSIPLPTQTEPPATLEPSLPPTSSPTGAPTDKPLSVAVGKERLTAVAKEYKYDVYMPVFTVAGDETLAAWLHGAIREPMNDIVSRFIAWAQSNPPTGSAGLNDLSFDFEVTRNDGRYLSLYGVATAYMGGASTDNFGFAFSVDIIARQTLTLEGLLGSGYEPLVGSLIRARLIADYGDAPSAYDLFGVGPSSGFTDGDAPHFYLTPDHMGFLYDKYVLYPGAYGAVRAEVPIRDLPAPFGGGEAEISAALCTGFNAASGPITLDYGEILTGAAAVRALMEDEHLTRAQAEDRIYDHEPNEYIRNRNTRLRTFAMDDGTVITLVGNADGTVTPQGYLCSYADFLGLYAVRPGAVVSENQLYTVTVSGGRVVALTQEYRP